MHLRRSPPSTGGYNYLRLVRRLLGPRSDAGEASFAGPLLLLNLPATRIPRVYPKAMGLFCVWPGLPELERFRQSPAGRHLGGGSEWLELSLRPFNSHGSWHGTDPLAGITSDPGPGPALFLTYARVRPSRLPWFWRTGRKATSALHERGDCRWATSFSDRPFTIGAGTISVWPSTSTGTHFAYGPGAHQDAIRKEKAGRWFAESWFGRFSVIGVDGRWRGLDVEELRRAIPAPGDTPG